MGAARVELRAGRAAAPEPDAPTPNLEGASSARVGLARADLSFNPRNRRALRSARLAAP
jgi:hypothetical protein